VRTASPKQPRSFFFYCGIIGIVWTIVIVLGGSDTVAVSNAILHAGLGPLIFVGLATTWAFCAMCSIALVAVWVQNVYRRLRS
jgi:hypothetical protein